MPLSFYPIPWSLLLAPKLPSLSRCCDAATTVVHRLIFHRRRPSCCCRILVFTSLCRASLVVANQPGPSLSHIHLHRRLSSFNKAVDVFKLRVLLFLCQIHRWRWRSLSPPSEQPPPPWLFPIPRKRRLIFIPHKRLRHHCCLPPSMPPS